jgi:putative sporulation protein YyaC
MEYAFHLYNQTAVNGLSMAIDRLLKNDLSQKLTPPSILKTVGAGTRSRAEKAENKAFCKAFDGNFEKPPVLVCIGSDLAVGDSLGPITGSMLKHKTQGLNVFIYGSLSSPVTAKEMKYMRAFLRETHPGRQVIAIDAAVGEEGDIGLIKCSNTPLFPGAGANKKLGAIGDLSIMGIVAEKSIANFSLLNTTRLNLVYSMAEIISQALTDVLWNKQKTPSAYLNAKA